MDYVIFDLEWNNAFSPELDTYVCEIFEIGAVRVDEKGEIIDRFSEIIKPQILSEFNSRILELTHIDLESFKNAPTFDKVIGDFENFAQKPDTVMMSWSRSDLPVLLENYKYIYPGISYIPFMKKYMDLQVYVQSGLNTGSPNQISLTKAAELLGVVHDDLPPHSAINDSIVAARCLAKVLDPKAMSGYIFNTDEKFFKNLLFKTVYISSVKDKRVCKDDFKFECPECGRTLKGKKNWKYRNHSFFNIMKCSKCKAQYKCVFRAKETGEGVQKSSKIIKITEDEEK